jgi:putative sigma-54 modulation protein
MKGKRATIKRRSAVASVTEAEIAATYLPEEEETVEEEIRGEIVRTKRFVVQPMYAEEAIEQMELLGHDFFIYFNVDDSQIQVVYRRRDGNYGLLQPETV